MSLKKTTKICSSQENRESNSKRDDWKLGIALFILPYFVV